MGLCACVRRSFESAAEPAAGELTTRTPTLATATSSVGPLADRLAGRAGATFGIETVTVAETQAEKVLSFLRRFAQHRAGQMQCEWDTALVRHIYDVHCIHVRHPDLLTVAAPQPSLCL